MDNIFLCIVLLFGLSLLPHIHHLLVFVTCFYIGFKLICKDFEIEINLRRYLAEKIRNFIRNIESMEM